ncbi:hypothetical protein ACS0TY_031806 [Phlomoides rotata]
MEEEIKIQRNDMECVNCLCCVNSAAYITDPTKPGPIDHSVLYEQDDHVSSDVWEGQERGALKCPELTSKLDQWLLTEQQIKLVEKAGFGHLRLIPAISIDSSLISALVERWRRETNTFHMTVGEMTVSLEDVAYLLGLPTDGKAVIGVAHPKCDSICFKYLGKSPDSSVGGMVKLKWLKEEFSKCPEDVSAKDVASHTRAYLLYLVGRTIFSSTNGCSVPVMYLPLFENFDEAGKYAWGAAALSFLYRALGNASARRQSTIGGCLTLLQCWSYCHLRIGRPELDHDPNDKCFPYVLRWKGKHKGPTPNRDVRSYREALDSLHLDDVVWRPYANIDRTVVPTNIRRQLVLGRSQTMLICFDKAERHLPDRCLRQFGMHQTVPEPVKKWMRKTRAGNGGRGVDMESEVKEWENRQILIEEADDHLDEYMKWYVKITRRLIGKPISFSSESRRLIADTVSTQGMDHEQIQSAATRIQDIADEGLGGRSSLAVADVGSKRRREDVAETNNVSDPAQIIYLPPGDDGVDETGNRRPAGDFM